MRTLPQQISWSGTRGWCRYLIVAISSQNVSCSADQVCFEETSKKHHGDFRCRSWCALAPERFIQNHERNASDFDIRPRVLLALNPVLKLWQKYKSDHCILHFVPFILELLLQNQKQAHVWFPRDFNIRRIPHLNSDRISHSFMRISPVSRQIISRSFCSWFTFLIAQCALSACCSLKGAHHALHQQGSSAVQGARGVVNHGHRRMRRLLRCRWSCDHARKLLRIWCDCTSPGACQAGNALPCVTV